MKKLLWETKTTDKMLLDALLDNDIILGTTDTVAGLLSIPHKITFDKLNKIKGRYDKPYLILVGDKQKIVHYVQGDSDRAVQRLIDECWPGPLTLIFKAKKSIPSFMTSAEGTIAIRVPEHEGLQRLLRHVDALFSTSANEAGEPMPQTLEEVDPAILRGVEIIIGDKIPHATTHASTILDVSSLPVKVIRKGAYPLSELERIYGNPFCR